jgi:hypothetical protein
MQRAVARLLPANPYLQQSPHVDKTMQIYDFYAAIGPKVVLTRPALMGKSTALSLLLHLHCGPMQFIGSALDTYLQPERDRWMGSTHYQPMTTNQIRTLYELTPLEFRRQFPVIYFNLEPLAAASATVLREYVISQCISFNAAYETKQEIGDIRTGLSKLLQALPTKGLELPAVFIDGFDAPLRDRWDPAFSERLAVMEEVGEALKADTKLVFCAGRSADPQLLDLSSWAAFEDISTKGKYEDLCGFRWDEVATTFKTALEAAQLRLGLNPEQLKTRLQDWFGGFCFSNKVDNPLLCPYSLTQFFTTFSFQNYRKSTVTPQDVSAIIKFHPEILSSTLLYKVRNDNALLTPGHDSNPFDLQESLGVLFRLGLLAPIRVGFPDLLYLKVGNRCAVEILAKAYVYTACGHLFMRVKEALKPIFQPDLVKKVISVGLRNVSIETFKAALSILGELEDIGKVHIGVDYLDLQVADKYTVRVNIVVERNERSAASFLRTGKQDLPKTAREYGIELTFSPTTNKAELLAIGELTASGHLSTKSPSKPRKSH